MKLVFVTQVLDRGDAVLGFVHRWVQGLAACAERVRVLALEVGDTSGLPANVDWRVLGRRGHLARWFRYRSLLGEALRRDGFDALLTHMVPRYSLVAAGPARRAGVPHFLWYTHAGVDGRLIRAARLVDGVFTASEESLRIETPRKIVTGHGIDVAHFAADTGAAVSPPRLLSVGRLTPSKDPLTVLEALALLVGAGRDVHLDWAGGALARGDDEYGARVRARVSELGLSGRVRWLGAVPYAEIPALYRAATVFVSASRTGSVDKVVLEAMAAGRPVVTSNEAFPRVFAGLRRIGADAALAARLSFPAGDPTALAAQVGAWLDAGAPARDAAGASLRALVAQEHAVDPLMARLVAHMDAARGPREGRSMTHLLAQVGVVVPVWNAAAELEACLRSLAPAAAAGARIVVVDDASTDGAGGARARASRSRA
ncbi:MAG: glycosyltransferase [Planctomycetota bacterium]